MATTLTDISIERLLHMKASVRLTSYNNAIVIIDDISQLSLFREPTRINAICMFVCLEGEVESRANLESITLHANSMSLHLPGDIIQVTASRGMKGFAILISNEYQRQLKIDFRLRTQAYINLRGNTIIEMPEEETRLLEPYLVLLRKNIREGNGEVIRSLSEALSHTVLLAMSKAQAERAPEKASTTRGQQIFNRFMELLTDYHTRERSLGFYAEKLCLTPKYMSAMVKGYTGKGALDWINEYVVLEAKILLGNTDLNVQQIAYRLNFPTQSAFGKYFRQQTGMSPRNYRQRHGD